jgi:hypothetical protein
VTSTARPVTATPAPLATGDARAGSYSWVVLKVTGKDMVFIGGQNVTASDGLPLAPTDPPLRLDLRHGDTVWAVRGSAGTPIVVVTSEG